MAERRYGPIGSVDQHPAEKIVARYGTMYPGKPERTILHDKARIALARQSQDWHDEIYGKVQSLMFLLFFGSPEHSEAIMEATIDSIRRMHEAVKEGIATGHVPAPWDRHGREGGQG